MNVKEKLGCWHLLVLVAFTMLLLSLFAGCTTIRYVPVERVTERIANTTDTLIKSDSIWLHDSTSIIQRDDTIYKSQWHYRDRFKYIYKNSTDTLIVRDSIPKIVVKEKELSKTEKLYIRLGRLIVFLFICLGLLLFLLVYFKVKRCKR